MLNSLSFEGSFSLSVFFFLQRIFYDFVDGAAAVVFWASLLFIECFSFPFFYFPWLRLDGGENFHISLFLSVTSEVIAKAKSLGVARNSSDIIKSFEFKLFSTQKSFFCHNVVKVVREMHKQTLKWHCNNDVLSVKALMSLNCMQPWWHILILNPAVVGKDYFGWWRSEKSFEGERVQLFVYVAAFK